MKISTGVRLCFRFTLCIQQDIEVLQISNYSAQMTLLRPVEVPGFPGSPTWRLATRSPSFPLALSRETMATLEEDWSPIATRVPALLMTKVRGTRP